MHNPLITFIPFQKRVQPKQQSCIQQTKNSPSSMQTVRVLQNSAEPKPTAYVAAVNKTHKPDFVSIKQEQCYFSTKLCPSGSINQPSRTIKTILPSANQSKHSATRSSFQTAAQTTANKTIYLSFTSQSKDSATKSTCQIPAQTTANQSINLNANQGVQSHVIHRPVAIRPEAKTVQTLTSSSVPHTGVPLPQTASSPANSKTAPIYSLSSSPGQSHSSSLNVVMTKEFPSSVINVSMTKTGRSLTTNKNPALLRNLVNTSVVPAKSGVKAVNNNMVNDVSKSVPENKKYVGYSLQEVVGNVSAASTSSSSANNKCLLSMGPEISPNVLSYSSITSVANNNMSCIVSSPKVHNANIFIMTPKQRVTNSYHPVEENKKYLTKFSQKADQAALTGMTSVSIDSPIVNITTVDSLLPCVSSSIKTSLTLDPNLNHQVQQSEEMRVKSPESYIVRKRSLNAERKLKCKECNREFVTHLAYHTHMISHLKNDPVRKTQYKKQTVCSDCRKHFRNPFLLKSHMYTHTGEKPFICPYCERMFADRSNCNAHMRLHTERKRIFSCTTCNKSFTQRRYLYKHMVEICNVPERMFRTGLMSVKYHPDEENSDLFVEKQIITRFRNNEVFEDSVNHDDFKTAEQIDNGSVSFKDDLSITNSSSVLVEKMDYSEDKKVCKDDVINPSSSSVTKESFPCVNSRLSPYISCVRIDEGKYGLSRKSRKQDLSKTRVLLPDSFKMEKYPVVKCIRIDDELPYLRPLFKEIISNTNAYLTMHTMHINDNSVRNHDNAYHYTYKLCVGKKSKPAANLECQQDEEAIKAAKLAAAKEWQSRLVNGDFTTDEEEEDGEFEEEESSGDVNKTKSFKRKRLLSSSDVTDFTSDEDFTPKTGIIHNWSSSRRRRVKRNVKRVNFRGLRYRENDSDSSASSERLVKYKASSDKTTNKSKLVRKIIVKKVQTGRSSQHKIIKSEPSNIAKRRYNVVRSKTSQTRWFGKKAAESKSGDKKEKKEDENKKSDKESEKFHCVECDLKFMQQTNLVLHIVTNHLQTASFYQRHYYGSEQFVCKYCELACYSFQSFIQHVPVHTSDVLEKMAKYVISRSGYNSKKIKKDYKTKIKQEWSEYDSVSKQSFSNQCKPKVKQLDRAVRDQTFASVKNPALQDDSETSSGSTSTDSDEAEIYSSLKYSNTSHTVSSAKEKMSNTEVNNKSLSDVKQNNTSKHDAFCSNKNKSDRLKCCKVEFTSPNPDNDHRKRGIIQLKDNAIVCDVSPQKIIKTCGSQTDNDEVGPKHSHVPSSKYQVNNNKVQCPKLTVKRHQINMNANGRSMKTETDVQQSQSKSFGSSSFIDSFLSYVQTEESKIRKMKASQLQHYRPGQNKMMIKSKTSAKDKNKNNINSESLQSDTRQSTLNGHESKSTSSVLNCYDKKVSNVDKSNKTSSKNLDIDGLNIGSVKVKNKKPAKGQTNSSRHRQKSFLADQKTCVSSSVGQVSFSNCSHSAEVCNSSDIIVFGADSVMTGTDEQTLDKLTQLRVSRNRNQQVVSTGQQLSTPDGVSESTNCIDSLKMMNIKTLNTESAALGETEESLLDSDSVLNTMLNLGSNIPMASKLQLVKVSDPSSIASVKHHEKTLLEPFASELRSVKMSSLSSMEHIHKDETTHSNVEIDTAVKVSVSSSPSDKHVSFNKEPKLKKRESLSTSSVTDVSFVSKSLEERTEKRRTTENVCFQKEKNNSPLSSLAPVKSLFNASEVTCTVSSISKKCSSGESSLYDDDTSLMLNYSQNNNNSTCSSMEGKLSHTSKGIGDIFQNISVLKTPEMCDVSQNVCSMSQTPQNLEDSCMSHNSKAADDLKKSSIHSVTEVCSEDLPMQELNATSIAIECEATLQMTPLLSQIVPDLADAIIEGVGKDVDEMTISCEGTLKSVIVNINIDESNSGGPVLIEDENVDESNSATVLVHDELAEVGFKTKGSSSSVSECSEDTVSMDTDDSLTVDSDASSSTSQHNLTRSRHAIKPPKHCSEWFSKNLSSKKNKLKHKDMHSPVCAQNMSPDSPHREVTMFTHDTCCVTRKSPRADHAPKTKTCPCCL